MAIQSRHSRESPGKCLERKIREEIDNEKILCT